MSDPSALKNPKLALILFSILVERLGGHVVIDQADIDRIAFGRLVEDGMGDGSLEYRYLPRPRAD